MVSTHLKNISQIGSFPQVGVKIKNVRNHHPDHCFCSFLHFSWGVNSVTPYTNHQPGKKNKIPPKKGRNKSLCLQAIDAPILRERIPERHPVGLLDAAGKYIARGLGIERYIERDGLLKHQATSRVPSTIKYRFTIR